MTESPTVVFVNFLCADQIEPKAQKLVDGGRAVVVVDNSGEYEGPGTVVRSGANVGFGPACNRGVDAVDTAMFCLHNPDVALDVELIDQLGTTVERQGRGLAAPALQTPGGIIRNGYGYPSIIRQMKTITALLARRGSRPSKVASPSVREDPNQPGLYQRMRSLGSKRFASAALLVGDVTTFASIGGFDHRFVLYGEDLDLWHRYSLAGSPGTFRNDLMARHQRGGGSPTTRPVRELLRWAGVETFTQIHGRPDAWVPYRLLHRTALARVGGGGDVASLLSDLWLAGRDPLTVAAELRVAFEAGLMKSESGDTDD
ncbi:MAG: glycosyltransferase family 2 protein [Acidimicrobiales bacterium]